MKILVTGGAGFIGSNLALELERQGNEVIVMDNFFTGHRENLKGFKGKIIEADVSQPFDFKEKISIIHHQAAITDPRYPNDEETYSKNVSGFKNMVRLARKNNAKLIYASSASMYGNGPAPQREEQEKDILSAYAKSKLEMHRIAESLFNKMHIFGLRYFNVFGPHEQGKGRPASMIYHLSQQMKAGKRPRIFKMGQQKRDHIYVKDAVDATINAQYANQSCVVNIGTGIGTAFNEVVEALNEALGTSLEPEYFDNPYGNNYQNWTQADTSKCGKMMGWKAKWNFRDAVKDYMGELYGK